MKRNKYIKYIISSLLISILSLAWIIAIYHSNKIDIESKLEPSLRVAVDRDLNTRFAKSGMPYSTTNTGIKINRKTIIKEDRKERVYSYKTTNILRYTNIVDELMKQSCLNDFLPINPDTLNKYLSNELRLKNINAATAIKVTDLIKKQSKTTQDTTLYNSYNYIFSYLLGDEDELRLDVHIQYTFISILFHKGIIWLSLFICLCTLITCIYLIRQLHQWKKEYKIIKLDEDIYRLGESIFNNKEGILYKGNKTTTKVRKQEAKLLIAFLEAPNYFLSIDDINTTIWESKKIETAKRIHTLISDLRGDVAPDLDIIKDSNKGYHLCLHAY